jgi:hypothetical protein
MMILLEGDYSILSRRIIEKIKMKNKIYILRRSNASALKGNYACNKLHYTDHYTTAIFECLYDNCRVIIHALDYNTIPIV